MDKVRDFIQKIWVGIGTMIVGGAAVIKPFIDLFGKLKGLSFTDYVFSIAGLLFIFLGVYFLLYRAAIINAAKKLSLISDGLKGIDGILHYHNRNKLPRLDEELKNSTIVWALWHGGAQAEACDIYNRKVIKKLLFIEPEKNSFEPLKSFIYKYWGKTPQAVADEVRGHIEQAQKNNTEVKCINFIPKYLILISNPQSPTGWIRIEEFNLDINHNNRQSFTIFKANQGHLFKSLIDYYNYLWTEKGQLPKLQNCD